MSTINLTSSPNPSLVNQQVTFTVMSDGTLDPTGMYEVTIDLGDASAFIDTVTGAELNTGYDVPYTYNTTDDFAVSTSVTRNNILIGSDALVQMVRVGTTTDLVIEPAIGNTNNLIAFTVSVMAADFSTVNEGTVTITSSPDPIAGVDGTYAVSGGEIAPIEEMVENMNSYVITATYSGTDTYASSQDVETLLIICILPGAKVHTPYGYKLIEDIRAGDLVVDEYGNHVKIINNIKSGSGLKDVVTINKGSLGYGLPKENLSITHGHPIKKPTVNGFTKSEYLVENLVNKHSIYTKQRKISSCYSLITENRVFVMVNGIPVCTWSEKKFNDFCKNLKSKNNIVLHTLL